MKIIIQLTFISCLVCTNLVFAADAIDKTELTEQAIGKIKGFGKQLKTTLKSAIKHGGFEQGINVCKEVADDIALQHSSSTWTITRKSIKNRNPNNKPTPWELSQLEKLEQLKTSGIAMNKLALSDVISKGDVNEFKFVKAIPTDKLCLNCHGKQIQPNVKSLLSKLYPNDLATGYSEGDIRGAFVVSKKL